MRRLLCFHRPNESMKGCYSSKVYAYFDPCDLWIGVYVSTEAVYVCILPTLVIRWSRW